MISKFRWKVLKESSYVHCVTEKRYPDFRHALGTQYVCDAVLEFARTGQWVNVKKS